MTCQTSEMEDAMPELPLMVTDGGCLNHVIPSAKDAVGNGNAAMKEAAMRSLGAEAAVSAQLRSSAKLRDMNLPC